MVGKLAGKVTVVTGATSGIGLATAKCFAAEGAFVFLTGRRELELATAVAAIGANAFGVQADSSKMPDLDRLFSEVEKLKGRIDVLFVSAGGGSFLPLGEITEEHYADIFDRNVKGLLFTVQKALPLLVPGASVILTGSTAGIKGTQNFSIYSASKAAVRNLARSWVLDLRSRGIRVNVISPGPIRTPGLADLVGDDAARQQIFLDQLAAQIPSGRLGDPDEVGKAAVFLASDDASFINGAELFVDGGLAQI